MQSTGDENLQKLGKEAGKKVGETDAVGHQSGTDRRQGMRLETMVSKSKTLRRKVKPNED